MHVVEIVWNWLAGSVNIPAWMIALVFLAIFALIAIRVIRKIVKDCRDYPYGRPITENDDIRWLNKVASPCDSSDLCGAVGIDEGTVVYVEGGQYPFLERKSMAFSELVRMADAGETLPKQWIAHLTVRYEYGRRQEGYFFGRTSEFPSPWQVHIIDDPTVPGSRFCDSWTAELCSTKSTQNGRVKRIFRTSREEFLAELLNIMAFFTSVDRIEVIQLRKRGQEVAVKMWGATNSPLMKEYRLELEKRDWSSSLEIIGFDDLMRSC